MCSPRTKMVRLLVVLVGLGSLAAAESGTDVGDELRLIDVPG